MVAVREEDSLSNKKNSTMGKQVEVIVLNDASTGGERESTEKVEKHDPFALMEDFSTSGPKWSELSTSGKVQCVLRALVKTCALIALMYMFICSLSFLSSGFRLLGGKAAGEAFSSIEVLQNPIAGLMIGVLATVLVQSSSTSTSIVVAMVAAKIIGVRPAIPIIMGANIGTSVTNTLVSLAQMSDRDQFRKAFAGATVHDMFNMLTVIIFLPIEWSCGYLYYLTDFLIAKMKFPKGGSATSKRDFLKKLTNPFTKLVIQLDKSVITKIAKGDKSAESKSLIKYWCDKGVKTVIQVPVGTIAPGHQNASSLSNTTTAFVNKTIKVYSKPCKFLLHDTGLSDTTIGVIVLICSLIILCCCLIAIVKLLNSMLQGKIALAIRKTVNNDFPKPFGFLTGYCAILVGAGMTFLVQSSSIFTSTLTPLVGLGVVSIERIFPLTLGSNIGTTGTSLIAALASSSDTMAYALQIALCHLFFNLSGIALWYPVPFMRQLPINMAKCLGNTTATYRWFAPLYIIIFFFLVPAAIFGLSMAGRYYFIGFGGSIALLILFIVVVNVMQSKAVRFLPSGLRTWNWAPVWFRSLEPYDKLIVKICEFKKTIRFRKRGVSVHLNTAGEFDNNASRFSIATQL
eukprot:gene3575-4079_t